MRVVVAGGAGFIGMSLCSRLLDRGDEVVCVDNLITGSRSHVAALSARPGFCWVDADIAEAVPVEGPIDVIYNLACPASPADFAPLAMEILAVGSTGLQNLADLAVARRARLLHASTSEVYGDPLVHPQPESYWGNVNPIGHRSVYDEAKRFGEAMLSAYRRAGLDTALVRIFNTYGPGMRPDDGRVVSTFVSQALAGEPLTVQGSGEQTRSLCFVEDLVDGLMTMMASDLPGPVNLGNDDERTVRELAELIRNLAGSSSSIVSVAALPDDPTQRRPDLTLARTRLGWAPSTPLSVGLTKTIEWFAALRPGA
ncbi:MAG: NAD-dependent epimerase/dehydratase family protein [Actinomycetota bacterium]|nr:NAD-dependent epimerase/dehydratase family protein [Actinomycetota bacterium]